MSKASDLNAYKATLNQFELIQFYDTLSPEEQIRRAEEWKRGKGFIGIEKTIDELERRIKKDFDTLSENNISEIKNKLGTIINELKEINS